MNDVKAFGQGDVHRLEERSTRGCGVFDHCHAVTGFDQWLVGFKGTTDGVLWAETAQVTAMPDPFVEAVTVKILEAKGPGEAESLQPYDREYRRQIESDIADAAVASSRP